MYFPFTRPCSMLEQHQCDEHGHGHYDATKEAARQQFIQTQLGCRFHRFDPYEDGFCVHRLTGQLMQLLMNAK